MQKLSMKSFGDVYKEIKSSILQNNSSFFYEIKKIKLKNFKISKNFWFLKKFNTYYNLYFFLFNEICAMHFAVPFSAIITFFNSIIKSVLCRGWGGGAAGENMLLTLLLIGIIFYFLLSFQILK